MPLYLIILCLAFFYGPGTSLFAQNQDLPLSEQLLSSSERMKVKLGASYLGSTFKIKAGSYTLNRAKRKNDYSDKEKSSGVIDNSYTSSFTTQLIAPSKDTVYVEVEEGVNKKEVSEKLLFDFFTLREYELLEDSYAATVLLRTSRDREEQWLLLLSRGSGNNFLAAETTMTNGKDRITLKFLKSDTKESMWKSAAEGIEFYLNEQSLGAFQYKSVGMGYKQYVWVSNETTEHQKLLVVASSTVLIELLHGGRGYGFE